MNLTQEAISDITIFNKYSRYIPEIGRRETWDEICERNMAMHINKFPHMREEIKEAYKYVFEKKALPSMRSMQFAGRSIELSNNRIFNCAYAPVDHPAVFSEAMFLLLGGTGFGFSVQRHHVEKLPLIQGPMDRTRRHLIGDSIEGWADSIKVLIKAYTKGKSRPVFDFRDIRPKGAMLVTSGGKAPGPGPLKACLVHIEEILDNAIGRQLSTVECHDIMCHIADAVLVGGIRRAALISLFSKDDDEMLTSKSGAWWEKTPFRGRANNSVVLDRETTTKEEFLTIWKQVEASGAGEPGVFWTNDLNLGTNPCAEISLQPCQMCNLSETNVDDVHTQEELNARVKAAALIGTIQATYTDFHYLRNIWKDTTDKEALIGVGMTGIGSGAILPLNLKEAAEVVKLENERVAKLLGINPSARCTTVKPSGTSSLTVGSSSGIHAWHNDYYIRRMRVGKNEAMYRYMKEHIPALVEDCAHKPNIEAVMSFPQKAPDGAIIRTESFMDLLERVKRFNIDWVQSGHRTGRNFHNVSCTISLKENEWAQCGEWMWINREYYTGISVIPYNGGTYIQAPFEDITKEVYEEMLKHMENINISDIKENDDNTALNDQQACAGGACEI